MVLQHGIIKDPAMKPLDHPKSKMLLGDLQRLAKARNADTSDKLTRDRKNVAMTQYTESLIPILIKRMVDGDSANKAEAEASTIAPKERGNPTGLNARHNSHERG
jgi:hypothetical protein